MPEASTQKLRHIHAMESYTVVRKNTVMACAYQWVFMEHVVLSAMRRTEAE